MFISKQWSFNPAACLWCFVLFLITWSDRLRSLKQETRRHRGDWRVYPEWDSQVRGQWYKQRCVAEVREESQDTYALLAIMPEPMLTAGTQGRVAGSAHVVLLQHGWMILSERRRQPLVCPACGAHTLRKPLQGLWETHPTSVKMQRFERFGCLRNNQIIWAQCSWQNSLKQRL